MRMSSDLKMKKLRGSGGYVMAAVDDEQQRKGNLGGPDLFLAPIGRLDEGRISKHFCNVCEKEFEGGPKIDYENPNEQVADNLVLVERGQYVCTSCGSTIAEYREFLKPDQTTDAGNARPAGDLAAEQPGYGAAEPPSEPEPAVQAEPPAAADAGQLGSVNAIIGLTVYDQDARRIGTAKEVGIGPAQTLALVVSKDDGTEETVAWDQVRKIGDIVVLGGAAEPAQQAPQADGCPKCGFSNKPGSKFCEECGTKI